LPVVTNPRAAVSWGAPEKAGVPDYQEGVHRGAVAHRIVLNDNESLRVFAVLLTDLALVLPHAKAPLGSGLMSHFVDMTTGIDMPFTVPIDYTLSVFYFWWSFDQPTRTRIFYDTAHWIEILEDAYRTHYEHDILPDYDPLDPTGLAAHDWDMQVTNEGTADTMGYSVMWAKLIDLRSPPFPETKEVRCPYCDYRHEVDRRLGKVVCPKCGGKTTYMPILFGGERRIV